MSDLEEQVRALVAHAAGRKPEDIALNARLRADLGIDGGRAHGFIRAFVVNFPDLDMSGMDWPRYFDAKEADWLAPGVIMVMRLHPDFRERWARLRAEDREITPAHLVRVVEAGHWIDPGPSSHATPFHVAPALFGLAMLLIASAASGVLVFGLLGAASLVIAAIAWLFVLAGIVALTVRNVDRMFD